MSSPEYGNRPSDTGSSDILAELALDLHRSFRNVSFKSRLPSASAFSLPAPSSNRLWRFGKPRRPTCWGHSKPYIVELGATGVAFHGEYNAAVGRI
jgi:hypothetical protein